MPTLVETLNMIGASTDELAARTGLSRSAVANIVNGNGQRYSRRARGMVAGAINAMRLEAGLPPHVYTAASVRPAPRPSPELLRDLYLEVSR